MDIFENFLKYHIRKYINVLKYKRLKTMIKMR